MAFAKMDLTLESDADAEAGGELLSDVPAGFSARDLGVVGLPLPGGRRAAKLALAASSVLLVGAAGALLCSRAGQPGPLAGGNLQGVHALDETKQERAEVADGCWTITDRTECCSKKDGRPWKYKGQDCVPSKPGKTFDEDRVCQPRCWVEGSCVWNHMKLEDIETYVQHHMNLSTSCPGEERIRMPSDEKLEEDIKEEAAEEAKEAEAKDNKEADDDEDVNVEDDKEEEKEVAPPDEPVPADEWLALAKERAQEAEKQLKRRDCLLEEITFAPISMIGTAAVVEKTVKSCQAKCEGTKGCYHFAFQAATRECYMQDVWAVKVTDQVGFVSGPPKCLDKLDASKTADIGSMTYVPKKFGCLRVGQIFTPVLEGSIAYSDETGPQATEQCRKKCEDLEGCGKFTVTFPAKQCDLSPADATETEVTYSAVSGPLHCDED